MDRLGYRRIAIVGNNGSGKSHLARELGAATGLPVIHLDLEYWRPGWEAPSQEEWAAIQREMTARECWIIDGNHSTTMELRFQAADLVVFLDRNRLVCLAGVLRRHGRERPDIPRGLNDRVDRHYVRMLLGLITFPRNRRKAILELHQRYPETAFVRIRSKKEMRWLLRG